MKKNDIFVEKVQLIKITKKYLNEINKLINYFL